MKRLLFASIIMVGLFAATSALATDPYWAEAVWSKKDLRSSNPASRVALQVMPSVSIDNGVMFMSFNTDLSDLKVSVTTAKGAIVYETVVSGNGGLTLPLRLGLRTGSYMLVLSHPQIGAMADKISVN